MAMSEPPSPVDSAVPSELRADLLAVLREALSNVVRHAGARAVQVGVEVGGGRLRLRVSDDGGGVPEEGRRSGITNMRTRAEKAGGSFDLRPNSPRGTVVEWTVPV